jgi:hypothetical protein
MTLPLLKDLSMADVAEIRNLPEWFAFKEKQAAILKEPARCLDLFEAFQLDFDNFQRALSEWFYRKYEQKQTEERYFNHVTLALGLGGKLLIAGMDLGPITKTLAGFAADRLAGYIPNKIKGCAVKLMVNVYDSGQMKLDGDRSYSVELMRTNSELTREDVEYLLHSVSRKGGPSVNNDTAQWLAEQGQSGNQQ